MKTNIDFGNKPIWILIAVIPIILYLPGIFGKIPYPSQTARYSDFLISHYPYALYIQNSVQEFGQIPLWADFLYSGLPLAANPLASLWYPPHWLALLLPLPAGLSLLAALHCGLGGVGAYYLLQAEGINKQGALLAGLTFSLMPKIYAHFGAGHLTLVYALAWTPWLLKVAWAQNPFIKSGFVLGVIFLADPRWTPYAGLIWLIYIVAHRQRNLFQTAAGVFLAGITAAVISAPLLMPFLQFVEQSTRLKMSSAVMLDGSLKPLDFLGLIIPGWGSNHELFSYIGPGGLLALIVTIRGMRTKQNQIFWPIVFLLACILALGGNLPGSDLISSIPFLSLGRVPARSLFLAGFAAAGMLGMFLDKMQQGSHDSKFLDYLGFGFFIFGAAILIYVVSQKELLLKNILWSAVMFILIGGALFTMKYKRLQKTALIALFILINTDYIFSNLVSIDWRFEPGEEIGRTIAKLNSGNHRIYSPSYSLTQINAVRYGLEIADGVDPLQLKSYQDFMVKGSGVPFEGYSVSIPPYKTGDPDQDNDGYSPDPEQLGLLNVNYLVSQFPLINSDFVLVKDIEGQYIYINEKNKPRAWIEGQEQIKMDEVIQVDILLDSPNRIELSATGPGKLVISEIDYPGWQVMVNGQEQEIRQSYGLLRSVTLDPGSNHIIFFFRPTLVYIGIVISGLGIGFGILRTSKSKKHD